LGTLQFLEAFEVEWIYSGHWPAYHGAALAEFLVECRRFMDNASFLVWKTLERHPEGVTLPACIEDYGPALKSCPAANQWLLMYPLRGHLLYLKQQGTVKKIKSEGHTCWKLAA
jgi:hypothetical protein